MHNEKKRPSIILAYLLGLDFYELKDILEDAPAIVHLLDRISSGIYIFIDKVDQAFSVERLQNNKKSRNASYWQYCQYGLANAAYEMFKLYVQNEDDKNLHSPEYKWDNQEKAFFGFERLNHVYVKDVNETVFDCLYRYSLRRPYDIMKICKELYLAGPKELTISKVRHIINETSGKVLKTYFSEVDPFITCDYEDIKKLLTCINTNIFDIDYIHYVCKRYNEEYEMVNVCNKDCGNCQNIHLFSILYNIRILGRLTSSSAHPIQRQSFLPIGGSKLKLNEYDLPTSSLYVLHPCLCDVARQLRSSKNRRFETANETIIGENIEIENEKITLIKKRKRYLMRGLDKEKVFVSSTI